MGIHRVHIAEIASPTRFKVLDLEAFDATPIIDVKPAFAPLAASTDSH